MLRGFIFDLDGTLGDTLPVCFQAFAAVFRRRLGRHFSPPEIHAMFGPSEEGILKRLCPEDPEGALEEYLAEYRVAHSSCPRPFPGVRNCLDLLAGSGVELAVVTGKGPRSAEISLERFDLAGRFPIVEAGSPDGGVKPTAMARVLAAWGLDPRQVAGVGDAVADVRSARRAGILSVAAAWAPDADGERLAACMPDRHFRRVADFRAWIEEVIDVRR